MLVISTIYCTELDAAEETVAEMPTQESTVDLSDAVRQLLSIYQGQNRVLPADWESWCARETSPYCYLLLRTLRPKLSARFPSLLQKLHCAGNIRCALMHKKRAWMRRNISAVYCIFRALSGFELCREVRGGSTERG
jgi:hypothetical protein